MIEIVRRRPPKHRLLKNGEHAYLVALSDGRPALSILTGVDRRFWRLAGERQGWFSRLEGEDDPEAARALLRAVSDFQRSLGSERLVGPDAPDGRFLPGLPVEGADAAPHLDRLLRENGFEAIGSFQSFEIERADLPGLPRAAARAREMHGVDVRRARFTRESCRAVYGLYEDARLPFDQFAAELSAMRPFELFIASVRGVDAGFALARRSGALRRVETLMIAPRFRRGPALLCLVNAMRKRLGSRVETGAIERENEPSLAVVRALGGVARQSWRVYRLYLI